MGVYEYTVDTSHCSRVYQRPVCTALEYPRICMESQPGPSAQTFPQKFMRFMMSAVMQITRSLSICGYVCMTAYVRF